jgi:hypothetical protein
LHALQEVWNLCQDAFQLEEGETSQPEVTDIPKQQLFLLLSAAAMSGRASGRTMQFRGALLGQSILILVDSGSSLLFVPRNFQWQYGQFKGMSSILTSKCFR